MMERSWDATGVAFSVAFWREVLRVAKPGAYLAAFGGTRTAHRMVCAIEDAGWTIAGSIQWIYAQGFPKSRASLKPAHEPICLARKPLSEPNVEANVARWGTGALHIEASKVVTPGVEGQLGRWTPDLVFSHTMFCTLTGHTAIDLDGHYPAKGGRGGISTSGHRGYTDAVDQRTGSEVVEVWDCDPACPVRQIDAQAGPQRSGGSPPRRKADTRRATYGTFGGQETVAHTVVPSSGGSVSRFYPTMHPDEQYLFRYCPKATEEERNLGLARPDDLPLFGGEPRAINDHVSVKPLDLTCWLVRLLTPPGGLVLDPFVGSGTTVIAASLFGHPCVGIDQSSAYLDLARQRLAHYQHHPTRRTVN